VTRSWGGAAARDGLAGLVASPDERAGAVGSSGGDSAAAARRAAALAFASATRSLNDISPVFGAAAVEASAPPEAALSLRGGDVFFLPRRNNRRNREGFFCLPPGPPSPVTGAEDTAVLLRLNHLRT